MGNLWKEGMVLFFLDFVWWSSLVRTNLFPHELRHVMKPEVVGYFGLRLREKKRSPRISLRAHREHLQDRHNYVNQHLKESEDRVWNRKNPGE